MYLLDFIIHLSFNRLLCSAYKQTFNTNEGVHEPHKTCTHAHIRTIEITLFTYKDIQWLSSVHISCTVTRSIHRRIKHVWTP